MRRNGKKNPRKQPNKDLEDTRKSMEISAYFSRVFSNPIDERLRQTCTYCSCVKCIKLAADIYMWHGEMVLEVIMDYEGIRYIECLFCTQSLNIFEKDQLLWHNKRQKQLMKGTCGISAGLCEKVANEIAVEEASMIRKRYFQVQVCSSQASSSKSTERLMYQ